MPDVRRFDTPVWFVSDVHITSHDDAYLQRFLDFLERAAANAKSLVIAGDLFEFWIGDRQGRFDFYDPLFRKLSEVTTRDLRVGIMQGNRDFLIGRRFAEVGCELLPEEVVVQLGDLTTHVSHGDQFCLSDRSYLLARRAMRSRVVRAVAACMPAGMGALLARAYRRISERKKAAAKFRTGNRFHTIEEGVHQELAQGGYDALICGHIHWPREQTVVVDGRPRVVVTTGAWEEGPNHVEFDAGGLRLVMHGAESSSRS